MRGFRFAVVLVGALACGIVPALFIGADAWQYGRIRKRTYALTILLNALVLGFLLWISRGGAALPLAPGIVVTVLGLTLVLGVDLTTRQPSEVTSSEDGGPPSRAEPLGTAPQAAVKVCPDCAEAVKAAARKCRYCGYRFADIESDGRS